VLVLDLGFEGKQFPKLPLEKAAGMPTHPAQRLAIQWWMQAAFKSSQGRNSGRNLEE